jgi:thiol-disulfide isomerase/thioredoxin
MFDFLHNISSNLMKNKKVLIIILVIIFFLSVAIYVYRNHVMPSIKESDTKPYKHGMAGDDADEKYVDLYFFYTEWCPHCKKAKPEWSKLVNSLENKKVNGYTVLFKSVDCDKETDLAEKFNVEGYPTIKLVKDGQVIEYDAKPEFDNLNQFLETVL